MSTFKVFSALIITTFALSACTVPSNHLIKMVMPGKHEVPLQPGNYQLWFARNWRSKGVSSKDATKVTIQIVDHSNKAIDQTPAPANFGEQYKPTTHSAEMYSTFEVLADTECTFASDNTIVIIVVPADAVKVGLDSQFGIPDMDSDVGFVD